MLTVIATAQSAGNEVKTVSVSQLFPEHSHVNKRRPTFHLLNGRSWKSERLVWGGHTFADIVLTFKKQFYSRLLLSDTPDRRYSAFFSLADLLLGAR